MSKRLIWLGAIVGSSLGGYLPSLYGGGMFSVGSIVGSVVGGIIGIVAGYKLAAMLGV